ncbi:uncharacterized protein LOC122011261 [Zingiber officinale]|uniref:uncharacterized protein LOC122011261 n=1 Tax=Zingiber officinale TaxID=94328 RepID=UPI001C4BC986|nr:uncharacterized protein LOC122011261 [Zingiber officinale]
MVRKRVRRRGRALSPSASPAKRGLPSDDRRRPPRVAKYPATRRAALEEAAGATTAGCVALCCCCPCGLLNLLFVVALKLPAELLRRALLRLRWRRKQRRAKPRGWKPKDLAFCEDDDDLRLHDRGLTSEGTSTWPVISQSQDMAELEKEMLSKFRTAGFWRSLSRSQKEC